MVIETKKQLCGSAILRLLLFRYKSQFDLMNHLEKYATDIKCDAFKSGILRNNESKKHGSS